MKYLALILCLFCMTGCGMYERDVKADQDFVAPDGTEIKAGQDIYVDEQGKATAIPVDPATGKPRAKFTEIDVQKIEKQAEMVEKAGGSIPWGVGAIFAGIFGAVSAGGIAAAKRRNRDARVAAGVPPPSA